MNYGDIQIDRKKIEMKDSWISKNMIFVSGFYALCINFSALLALEYDFACVPNYEGRDFTIEETKLSGRVECRYGVETVFLRGRDGSLGSLEYGLGEFDDDKENKDIAREMIFREINKEEYDCEAR